MGNKMNMETRNFIEKLQAIGRELYNEGDRLDIDFTCPLSQMLDALYSFSMMSTEDAIDDQKNL